MDFDFSFEQRLLAESVGKALASFPTVADRPPFPHAAADVTRKLAGLGLFDVGDGRTALGHADAVAVAMAAGRTIVAAPVIEMLAASLSLAPGDAGIARRLAAGECFAISVSGSLRESAGRLSGRVLAPYASVASAILAPVEAGGERFWAALDPADCHLSPAETTDITAAASWVAVDGIAAPPRRNDGSAVPFDHTLQLLALAEMAGAAAACLERTVGYISERKQFGKPIGSNQAIKHMAADAAVAVETMRAAVEYAGWCGDQAETGVAEREEAGLALLTARSFVGEHARRVAERCIQMHGGIAFTWDYGLHVPLRRILFRAATLARVMEGRETLAGHIVDGTMGRGA